MRGPPVESLSPTDTRPDKVDAVVIGGGIVGLLTDLERRERRLRVAVLEKGELGAEQSSRNRGR